MPFPILKAPFPWYGGKSRVSGIVWRYFGNVQNFVEPFFGSGAVLLGRPHLPHIETVNDKDCFVANFWRAVKYDPKKTAQYADWPVNEADLHSRHSWLVKQRLRERVMKDPQFYDCQVAGWWVWGQSLWIGGGWCFEREEDRELKKSHPCLSSAGRGVKRSRPHTSNAGQGILSQTNRNQLIPYFQALQERLKNVRVLCGDWRRCLGKDDPELLNGITGVFLDPPYSDLARRDTGVYAVDSLQVAHDVRDWCLKYADNPRIRIALCGYEGEHVLPGWKCFAWKSSGGFSDVGKENSHKERIWFNPSCNRVTLI